MKNKKGFTLVELLAVIVVLGVIMTIAGTAVLNQKKKANVEEAKKMEDDIETLGTEVYLGEKSTGNYSLVCLTKYGLKSSNIKNPSGNGNCTGYLEIQETVDGPEFKGHIYCDGVYNTDGNWEKYKDSLKGC